MIMWTEHPRLDWIGVLSIIVQSCARFSGSLMTLVLLLCLCGGITGLQSDYDRRHFIIRGALYLTASCCACCEDNGIVL